MSWEEVTGLSADSVRDKHIGQAPGADDRPRHWIEMVLGSDWKIHVRELFFFQNHASFKSLSYLYFWTYFSFWKFLLTNVSLECWMALRAFAHWCRVLGRAELPKDVGAGRLVSQCLGSTEAFSEMGHQLVLHGQGRCKRACKPGSPKGLSSCFQTHYSILLSWTFLLHRFVKIFVACVTIDYENGHR